MKKLDELLEERCPDAVFATTRHYSVEEMLGKEDAKKLFAGEASLEDAVIIGDDGEKRKAKFYTARPETVYGNNWGSCFYTNYANWMLVNRPSGSVNLVFASLLAQVRYYNYVRVSQAKLVDKLKLSRGAVSEALSFLENTGAIESVPESHLPLIIKVKPKVERKWYRISLDLFWKGKAEELDRCPKNYKMKYRERDMEDSEIKTLEDALSKTDAFLPEV